MIELPVCQTCNGTGYGGDAGHVYNSQEEFEGFAEHSCRQCPVPCPSCGGSGWNITDEMLTIGSDAIETTFDDWAPCDWSEEVKACLVAVFDYLKENQTTQATDQT